MYRERSLVVLWLVLFVGVAARIMTLNDLVQFEEAFVFNRYASIPPSELLASAAGEDNHFAYNSAMNAIWHLLGTDAMLLRFPAFVAGILLIPISYQTARILYNRQIALWTTVLVAGLFPLIEASTLANGTTSVALLLTGTVWLCVRILSENRLGDWIWLGLGLWLSMVIVPLMVYPALTIILWLSLSILLDQKTAYRRKLMRRLWFVVVSIGALTLVCYLVLSLSSGLAEFVDAHRSNIHLSMSELHAGTGQVVMDVLAVPAIGLPNIIGYILVLLAFLGVLLHERASSFLVPPMLALLSAVALNALLHQAIPTQDYWIAITPIFVMTAAAGLVVILPYTKRLKAWIPVFATCLLITVPIFRPSIEDNNVVMDAVDIAADLEQQLQDGDTVIMVDPYSELIRYHLKHLGLQFDPVINPLQDTFSLRLSTNRIYTVSDINDLYSQATDYIDFGATNLRIDIESVEVYEDSRIEEIVVRSTVPVTTDTRQALFSDDFQSDAIGDHWDYDPATTILRQIGLNRFVEIDSDDEWVFFELADQGTLWIDYSLFARVRVLESGDSKDDAFLHVRYLPPIGSYAGSLNVEEDLGMLSADFDRAWRGPLNPVGLISLPDRQWHNLRVRAVGNSVQLSINGEPLLITHDDRIERGTVRVIVPPHHRIQIDDIVVLEEVDWRLELTNEDSFDSIGGIRQIVVSDEWQFIDLGNAALYEDLAVEMRLRLLNPILDEYDLLVLLRETWLGNYVAAFDMDAGKVAIGEDREGVWQGEIIESNAELAPSEWVELRVQVVEDSISILVDDQQVARTLDTRYREGQVTLAIPPEVALELDWIRLYERENAP